MTLRLPADRPWRVALLAVIGLLVAIIGIGVVGLVINGNIHRTVERAIDYDIALEDRGDDLRVAILELRHYHRDLLLNNPDATRVQLWRERYTVLVDEIGAVESVLEQRPDDPALSEVTQLRELATGYFDGFSSAVEGGIDNAADFRILAEDLLVPIDRMERIAQRIDQAGEERAAASFAAVDDASATGNLVLLGVMVGLGAMGGVLGYAVLRMVREQRRLVAVEQAAAAQMAELSQAKSDFIADASHELRTPLTVLRGNAEIGLSMGSGGDQREILTEIVNESVRMSRLIDDLLFLARSDKTSVPLELSDVDIARASSDMAARAGMLARERGATLEATLNAAGRIRADAARIDQALLVLVDNAAKYGPPGGIVELATEVEGDDLVIEVRDRGPGIPPELASQVFERFYRVRTDGRRQPRGAGLGLAIAAAIVEGHGGRIGVEQRPGGGTVMRVTVPLRAAAPVPE